MLEVEYKGGNAVVLTTKKGKLVIDPNLSVVGLKSLNTKDAVELATETRFTTESDDVKLRIDGPGEYEVGDFSVSGMSASRHLDDESVKKQGTIYRVEVGDVRIGVLGNIAPKLSEEQQEAIGVVDMLIIPVGGGGYTLDATSATALVRQIEPRIIIPVHYADSGLKYEVPQDTLETFTKELAAPVETTDKLKIKSSASLPQVMTVMEVTRS